MKPSIIHSIVVCLTAFALPFLVACSSQEEFLPEVESSYMAVFTLDLGNTAYGMTRATPTDGEYAPGSGLENYIDFYKKDFRCYLFNKEGTFISTLEVASIFEIGEKIFSIRLRFDDTEEVTNALTYGCRFVFLANWGNYDEPVHGSTTIENLCTSPAAVFGFSHQKTALSADNLIPMYGVKEFEDGVPDFKGKKDLPDIGTVHLLRAFAKVEVNINFDGFEENPEVTSVSLTHSSSKGYKAPANVTEEEQYVTGSWFTDYTPVNIPSDATDIGELTLSKDENTGHYIAYVPEYRNVNDQKAPLDNRSRIRICFSGDVATAGIPIQDYIDFRYSDNYPSVKEQHFDIARNNWYKFDVTVKGKDIVWAVDVIPFTSVELKPDYGLEREEFTGYIIGKDQEGRKCWYDGNYYNTDDAFPLYLGPADKPGEFVTINDKEYLLVYTDYDRTAATLDHFFEKETRKKYLLDPVGRTGYSFTLDPAHPEWGADIYYNKHQMRVWLNEDYNEWTESERWDADQGKNVDAWVWQAGTTWYRTLNEWDRLNWNQAIYWYWTHVYPKFWFDVLGNRYPWSEGDTKEKRAAILGEWVQYLE